MDWKELKNDPGSMSKFLASARSFSRVRMYELQRGMFDAALSGRAPLEIFARQ